MKTLSIFFSTLVLFVATAFAQAPQGISYQAIVRDAAGNVLPDSSVSLRLTITDGSGGLTVYQETHDTTTNPFGLVTLTIGSGTLVSGTFNTIDWGAITPWLQEEVDITGGTSYVNMGSYQLLSVPYALHATKADQAANAANAWSKNGNAGTDASSDFIGTTDNQDLVFKTTGTEQARLDTAGNLGIGTPTPSEKLDVQGNGRFSGTLRVGAYTLPAADGTSGQVLSTNGSGGVSWVNDSTGSSGWGLSGNAGTNSATDFVGTSDAQDFIIATTQPQNVILKTNNTEQARLDSAGHFGIGTSTPSEKLDVQGNGRFSGTLQVGAYTFPSTAGTPGQVLTMDASGSNVAWGNSGQGTAWNLTGNSGTNSSTDFIGTTDNQDLVVGTTQPQALIFKTTNAETARFTPAGNLGIGTPNPTAKLDVTGGDAIINGVTVGRGFGDVAQNTAVGNGALGSNNNLATSNTAIGFNALSSNQTGSNNTAIGSEALRFNNLAGLNNTAIGAGAGVTIEGLTNATAIGYNAKVGASNSLVLGGTGADAVSVGIGTISPSSQAGLHILKSGSQQIRVESTTGEADIHYIGDAGINWEAGTNNGGNGTSNNQFYIFDNAYRFTVQAGTGNVGIGTVNPNARLDVSGGNVALNNNKLILRNGGDQNHALGYNSDVDGPALYGYGGGWLGTNQSGSINKVLTWKSDGKVGIGTTSPSAKLDVRGDINLPWGFTFSHYEPGWGTHETHPWLKKNWSTTYGNFIYLGGTGTVPNSDQAAIFMSEYKGITFGKGKDDATGFSTAHMRITADGKVGIGTLSPDKELTVNGDASKPGGGSWKGFSDFRVKKDIQNFTEGLNVIRQINPVKFQYNGKGGYPDDGKEYIGLIAQDVQTYAPYMIEVVKKKLNETDQNETDILMLDNSSLIYVMVNAMKEQQAVIDTLQTQVQVLQSQNTEILRRIGELDAIDASSVR